MFRAREGPKAVPENVKEMRRGRGKKRAGQSEKFRSNICPNPSDRPGPRRCTEPGFASSSCAIANCQ